MGSREWDCRTDPPSKLNLNDLFEKYCPPTLKWLKKNVSTVVEMQDIAIVQSLISMMEGAENMRNSSETKDSWTNTLKLPLDFTRDSVDIKSRQSWLPAVVVYIFRFPRGIDVGRFRCQIVELTWADSGGEV